MYRGRKIRQFNLVNFSGTESRLKNFYVLIVSCCLFALPILAGTHQFEGYSEWNSGSSFSALEVQGIKFDAFMDARAECTRSGHEICILKHINMVNFNDRRYSAAHGKARSYTSYRALVVAVDHKLLRRGKLYEKKGSFTNSAEVSALETLAARFMAIDNALMACFQAGNDYCEFEDGGLNKTNSSYSNDAGNRRWRSDAYALVRGYKYLSK